MVLQGGTSPWLKTTLRQAYKDVSWGETSMCCIPWMLPRTGTLLWDMALGRHGWRQPNFSSTLKPGLLHHENSCHLLVSRLSCCSSGAGMSGLGFFLIGETENSVNGKGKSQNSHLPSSSYSLNETGTHLCALHRAWTARLSCGAPKTWQSDFLCPANQFWCFLTVSLPCPFPKSQYPLVYLLSVSM